MDHFEEYRVVFLIEAKSHATGTSECRFAPSDNACRKCRAIFPHGNRRQSLQEQGYVRDEAALVKALHFIRRGLRSFVEFACRDESIYERVIGA